MADRKKDRERLRAALTRPRSVAPLQRAARAGVEQAISELPPATRASLPSSISVRIGKSRKPSKALAFAGGFQKPTITFLATGAGRPKSKLPDVGVARHELAHIGGAGHVALGAATRQPGKSATPRSGFQTAAAIELQKRPGVRTQRVLRTRAPSAPKVSQTSSTQGFQTPQLMKVAQTGTASQRSRARQQMRKLGRRLRGRIDF
jgi:hypothetical protein